jgi:aryl-alcohol dehydrogenase-like predicted oxidoreductase
MKLALGTVQFGIDYGINNQTGVPSNNEIRTILDFSKENGICTIDCASSYGDAESKVGNLSDTSFDIITKFSETKEFEELDNQLNTSLKLLKRNEIYGYMAHNADNLINYPKLWTKLISIKEKGIVKKIGYSLYTPSQLESLLRMRMIPDIVQLPYSLLDKKFDFYLARLKSFGTEIHARSVFLQGLYFIEIESLPLKFELLKPELYNLHKLCELKKVTMVSLALNFVINNIYIDKVVIGVDSVNQLRENISCINKWVNDQEINEIVNSIKVKSQELLNPVNWGL